MKLRVIDIILVMYRCFATLKHDGNIVFLNCALFMKLVYDLAVSGN